MKYSPALFERLLKRLLARQVRAIEKAIDETIGMAAWQAGMIGTPKNGDFYFRNYPALSKRVDELLRGLSKKLLEQINVGTADAWELANLNNDRLIDYIVQSIGPGRIPPLALLRWQHATRNLEALKEFQRRKIGGLGLSQKVWLYCKSIKDDLELAIDIGLGDGKSADALSRSVRRFLRHPDALYRRVRDKKTGELRLSKAAQAFHPGQGVYRSAYKNARRLAATETNMAYRSADHQRRQRLDFVLGIRVNLSKNHTCLDSKGVPRPFFDICDVLEGNYPKWFKFVGWHPHCRCYTTTILPSKDEFLKYLAAMDENGVSSYKFKNQVTELPPQFKQWVADNAGRIERAQERGTLPYFLRDNDGWKQWMTEDSQKSILERAARRHAARTPEEVQEIKDRWSARLKTDFAPEWDESKKYATEFERKQALSLYIAKAYGSNDNARYARNALRGSRSVDYFLTKEGWGRTIAPTLALGKQYNTLTLTELSSINPVWRARYTELIKELNTQAKTCLWDKRALVGEAYNILQLSELAEAGELSVASVSTRTPYNYFTELKKAIPDAVLPKKEFFDKLGKYVILNIDKDYDGAHFDPNFEHVKFGLGPSQMRRFTTSPWYRETLFYHEFGHAQYEMLGVENNKDFKKAYNAFRKRMVENGDNSAEYWEKRRLIDKIRVSEEYRADLQNNKEMLGSYSDTLQAISATHDSIPPCGHSKSYFGTLHHRMTEIYAEISEAFWGGNRYYEMVDKTTFDAFMKFMRLFLGVK